MAWLWLAQASNFLMDPAVGALTAATKYLLLTTQAVDTNHPV